MERRSDIHIPKFTGPISGPMWKRLQELGSSYPDEFDYSVYDELAVRYRENAPQRSPLFKTALRLVNHQSSCTRCHYAFELDTYGRGCVHDCVYCYAKVQLTTYGNWNKPQPYPLDVSILREDLHRVFETDRKSKWRSILEKRIPLRIGSMSDSFMWMDKKYRVTQEVLKILRFYKYPYIVFTRSDLVADDEYLSLMDSKLASIQMSISGDNEAMTRKLEPGAPTVKRRFAALKKLSDAGFWTAVRVNPFFPPYPDGYYTDRPSVLERFGSLENVPRFDVMSDEFFDRVAESGTPTVVLGVVRLSPPAMNNIQEATNIDIRSFFKPEYLKINGDKRYSDSEVAFYYKKLHSECHRRGLRFSTCYIGNGEKDYYLHQDLWSNKRDCCDSRGKVPGFTSSSQEVPWDVRHLHARFKGVAVEGLAKDREAEQQFGHLAKKPSVRLLPSKPAQENVLPLA